MAQAYDYLVGFKADKSDLNNIETELRKVLSDGATIPVKVDVKSLEAASNRVIGKGITINPEAIRDLGALVEMVGQLAIKSDSIAHVFGGMSGSIAATTAKASENVNSLSKALNSLSDASTGKSTAGIQQLINKVQEAHQKLTGLQEVAASSGARNTSTINLGSDDYKVLSDNITKQKQELRLLLNQLNEALSGSKSPAIKNASKVFEDFAIGMEQTGARSTAFKKQLADIGEALTLIGSKTESTSKKAGEVAGATKTGFSQAVKEAELFISALDKVGRDISEIDVALRGLGASAKIGFEGAASTANEARASISRTRVEVSKPTVVPSTQTSGGGGGSRKKDKGPQSLGEDGEAVQRYVAYTAQPGRSVLLTQTKGENSTTTTQYNRPVIDMRRVQMGSTVKVAESEREPLWAARIVEDRHALLQDTTDKYRASMRTINSAEKELRMIPWDSGTTEKEKLQNAKNENKQLRTILKERLDILENFKQAGARFHPDKDENESRLIQRAIMAQEAEIRRLEERYATSQAHVNELQNKGKTGPSTFESNPAAAAEFSRFANASGYNLLGTSTRTQSGSRRSRGFNSPTVYKGQVLFGELIDRFEGINMPEGSARRTSDANLIIDNARKSAAKSMHNLESLDAALKAVPYDHTLTDLQKATGTHKILLKALTEYQNIVDQMGVAQGQFEAGSAGHAYTQHIMDQFTPRITETQAAEEAAAKDVLRLQNAQRAAAHTGRRGAGGDVRTPAQIAKDAGDELLRSTRSNAKAVERAQAGMGNLQYDTTLTDLSRAQKIYKLLLTQLAENQAIVNKLRTGVKNIASNEPIHQEIQAQISRYENEVAVLKKNVGEAGQQLNKLKAEFRNTFVDRLQQKAVAYAGYFAISQGMWAVWSQMGTQFKNAMNIEQLHKMQQAYVGPGYDSTAQERSMQDAMKVSKAWGQDLENMVEIQGLWLKQTDSAASMQDRLNTALYMSNISAMTARISNTKLAESYSTLTAIMRSTGMGVGEVESTMDSVVGVATKVGASMKTFKGDTAGISDVIKEIMDGLQAGAVIMNEWHMAPGQFAALVGTIQEGSGMKGAEIGQSLSEAFLQLYTVENRRKLSGANIHLNGSGDDIDKLIQGAQTMKAEKWSAFLGTLGLQKQLRDTVIRFTSGPAVSRLRETEGVAANSKGAFGKIAEEQNMTIQARLDQAQARIQAFTIMLARELFPALGLVLERINNLFDSFSNVGTGIGKVLPWLAQLTGAFFLAAKAQTAITAFQTAGGWKAWAQNISSATGVAATGIRGLTAAISLSTLELAAYAAIIAAITHEIAEFSRSNEDLSLSNMKDLATHYGNDGTLIGKIRSVPTALALVLKGVTFEDEAKTIDSMIRKQNPDKATANRLIATYRSGLAHGDKDKALSVLNTLHPSGSSSEEELTKQLQQIKTDQSMAAITKAANEATGSTGDLQEDIQSRITEAMKRVDERLANLTEETNTYKESVAKTEYAVNALTAAEEGLNRVYKDRYLTYTELHERAKLMQLEYNALGQQGQQLTNWVTAAPGVRAQLREISNEIPSDVSLATASGKSIYTAARDRAKSLQDATKKAQNTGMTDHTLWNNRFWVDTDRAVMEKQWGVNFSDADAGYLRQLQTRGFLIKSGGKYTLDLDSAQARQKQKLFATFRPNWDEHVRDLSGKGKGWYDVMADKWLYAMMMTYNLTGSRYYRAKLDLRPPSTAKGAIDVQIQERTAKSLVPAFLKAGDIVEGYRISRGYFKGGTSGDTHAHGGVFDITARGLNGKTFKEAANDLASQGFFVAIREASKKWGWDAHLHVAMPWTAGGKEEVARLIDLRRKTGSGTYVQPGHLMTTLSGTSEPGVTIDTKNATGNGQWQATVAASTAEKKKTVAGQITQTTLTEYQKRLELFNTDLKRRSLILDLMDVTGPGTPKAMALENLSRANERRGEDYRFNIDNPLQMLERGIGNLTRHMNQYGATLSDVSELQKLYNAQMKTFEHELTAATADYNKASKEEKALIGLRNYIQNPAVDAVWGNLPRIAAEFNGTAEERDNLFKNALMGKVINARIEDYWEKSPDNGNLVQKSRVVFDRDKKGNYTYTNTPGGMTPEQVQYLQSIMGGMNFSSMTSNAISTFLSADTQKKTEAFDRAGKAQEGVETAKQGAKNVPDVLIAQETEKYNHWFTMRQHYTESTESILKNAYSAAGAEYEKSQDYVRFLDTRNTLISDQIWWAQKQLDELQSRYNGGEITNPEDLKKSQAFQETIAQLRGEFDANNLAKIGQGAGAYRNELYLANLQAQDQYALRLQASQGLIGVGERQKAAGSALRELIGSQVDSLGEMLKKQLTVRDNAQVRLSEVLEKITSPEYRGSEGALASDAQAQRSIMENSTKIIEELNGKFDELGKLSAHLDKAQELQQNMTEAMHGFFMGGKLKDTFGPVAEGITKSKVYDFLDNVLGKSFKNAAQSIYLSPGEKAQVSAIEEGNNYLKQIATNTAKSTDTLANSPFIAPSPGTEGFSPMSLVTNVVGSALKLNAPDIKTIVGAATAKAIAVPAVAATQGSLHLLSSIWQNKPVGGPIPLTHTEFGLQAKPMSLQDMQGDQTTGSSTDFMHTKAMLSLHSAPMNVVFPNSTGTKSDKRKFGYGKEGLSDYLNAGVMMYGAYSMGADPNVSSTSAILSGAISGVSTGKAFGPTGTAIGAVVGVLGAILGISSRHKEVTQKIFDQMPKAKDLQWAAPSYLPFSAYAGSRGGAVQIKLSGELSTSSKAITNTVRDDVTDASRRGISGKAIYAQV